MKQFCTGAGLLGALVLFALTRPMGASAQTPVLLTDAGSVGSQPREFATFNGRLYFSANTRLFPSGSPAVIDGQEVYSTDGTPAGTSLLKNINTDAGAGSDPKEFTEHNGRLYFSAVSGANGRELWVTDGTAGGTVLVKDIFPGGSSGDPRELTACNGRLYFVAQNGPQRELWVSDGTADGTQRLSDALGVSTGGANPGALTCSGDKLFYRIGFNRLWFTNGTAANTKLIRGGPINPLNPDGPQQFISLGNFVPLDGKIIFRANAPGTEDEPWVSDGTPEGTFSLDLTPGGNASFPSITPESPVYNGRVYFVATRKLGADPPRTGLFATDGTAAGTALVKNISTASNFRVFNGKLYFVSGGQLWSTDGTEAGTLVVKEFSDGSGPRELEVVGDRLHFVVDGPSSPSTGGGQLWTSDGTEAGTSIRYTINHPSGFMGSSFMELIPYNDRLLFTAIQNFGAVTPPEPELWALDYTNLPPVAPAAGIANMTGTVGTPFFQVIPSFSDPEGFPMSYTVAGLPPGLTFSGGAGGIVAGTPTVAGVFPVTVAARDLGGLEASVTYTITINPVGGGTTLQLLAPAYNCGTGVITFNTSGGDGSSITFQAPGIQRASVTSPTGIVESELRNDPKPILIQARQGGTTASFTFDLPAACGGGPSPGGPALQLLAPAYNCATGAITFNTSGGDGSPIEYQAAGITDWSTNPTQFVDPDSRTADDVQPFTLNARQSGVVVSYVWNLKAACGRARLSTHEPVSKLTVTVLANPTTGETADVAITGAAGQPLQWLLSDARGRGIRTGRIEQAAAREQPAVRLGQEPGLYLLRVSTATQVTTVKIIRH